MGAASVAPTPFPPTFKEMAQMPKVEMLVRISGTRDGVDWPAPGELLDVPADEAATLVSNGFARKVEGASVKVEPEKATARRKPETRRGLTKDSLG